MRFLSGIIATALLLGIPSGGQAESPFFRHRLNDPTMGGRVTPDASQNGSVQALAVALDASPPPAVTLNAPYQATATPTGGVAPFTYELTGTIPPGITQQGPVVTGTFTQAGKYAFGIKVTDAKGATAVQALGVDVAPPLAVSITALPVADIGTPYSVTLGATGGTVPYAWSITGTLPNGLQLVGNTLSGTPKTGATSASGLTVTVTDAVGRSLARQGLSVVVNTPLQVTSTIFPTATVGVAYSQPLTAIGGVPPYSWYLSRWPPRGLQASNASIEGTPFRTLAATSNYLFATVTDSKGATSAARITLPVSGATATRIRYQAVIDALTAYGFRLSNTMFSDTGRPLANYFSRDDGVGLVTAEGFGIMHGGWATFNPMSDTTGILGSLVASREIYWYQDFSKQPTGQVADLKNQGNYMTFVDRQNGFVYEFTLY